MPFGFRSKRTRALQEPTHNTPNAELLRFSCSHVNPFSATKHRTVDLDSNLSNRSKSHKSGQSPNREQMHRLSRTFSRAITDSPYEPGQTLWRYCADS